MAIPAKVKIGPYNYSITMVDVVDRFNSNIDGSLSSREQAIIIEKKFGIDHTECTFWHEIIHGIDFAQSTKLTEEQVTAFAIGLYAFLKDNGYHGGGLPK